MNRTPPFIASFAFFVVAIFGVVRLPAQSRATADEPFELVGVVRGPDRKPMANAAVTLRWRTHPELPGLCGHTLGVSTRESRCDARGRFRIKVDVAGPFELLACNADGSLMSIRKFPVMVGGFVECELQKTPWIGGVVVDAMADNAPIAGFELELVPFQQTWARHRGCGSPLTKQGVKTGADGKWRLPFPSAYLREPFWEPYLVLVPADPSRKLGGASLLMPDESCRRLEITVQKESAIHGVVVDPEGKPVAKARVFDPYGPSASVLTDASGRFRTFNAKRDRVHVCADGFHVARAKDRVNDAGELEIELIRTKPRSVELRTPGGQVITGRPVLWSDQWGQFVQAEHHARTNDEGVVVLSGAGVGETCIGFVKTAGVYVPFVLPETEKRTVVTIKPRALAGTVADADGTPIAGARIVARSRDTEFENRGEPIWVTYSDHGGRFRFASLPQGAMVLVAIAGAAGFAKTEITATDERATLRTGKEEPFTIEVIDADEQPVKNVWVTMTSMGGPDDDYAATSPSAGATLVGFTGDDGQISFRGVPDARWLSLGMRLVGTRIEATPTVFPSRGTVTRIALSEHKR